MQDTIHVRKEDAVVIVEGVRVRRRCMHMHGEGGELSLTNQHMPTPRYSLGGINM
jgi:hypothetical protein